MITKNKRMRRVNVRNVGEGRTVEEKKKKAI